MIGSAKSKAKELLKDNLWNVFGAIVVVGVISFLIELIWKATGLTTTETYDIMGVSYEVTKTNSLASLIGSIISLITAAGLSFYVLNIVRGTKVGINEIFGYLKKNILTIILVSILEGLFIAVGFVLLIIPGIVIALGLSLSSYVLIDNQDLSFMDVIKKTWEMMKGHKIEYFLFGLSFIGWILFCAFIIPLIYVAPYITLAEAVYYESIKG